MNGPWSEIRIVFGMTVPATVDAEHRIGQMAFKILGRVPVDLEIFISEHVRSVNRSNYTWKFDNPTSFMINPTDQIVVDYVNSSRKKFGHVYMSFESKADHNEFYVQVTFPDQDAMDHRIRMRELADALPDHLKNLSAE